MFSSGVPGKGLLFRLLWILRSTVGVLGRRLRFDSWSVGLGVLGFVFVGGIFDW